MNAPLKLELAMVGFVRVRAMIPVVLALSGIGLFAQPAPFRMQVVTGTSATDLALQLETEVGWLYTVQRSADLVSWAPFQWTLADGQDVSWAFTSAAAEPRGFFRAKANPPNAVSVGAYNGWSNAVFLDNGIVQAVIVPAAGRVLQFRFLGDTNGPFWENKALAGKRATASSWNTEGSFGGDKAWPSPQSDWNWPPPSGFDGSTNAVSYTNGSVTLVSPVDATYKIRTTRVV